MAAVIADLLCCKDLNGKVIYVAGGRAWEIQDAIDGLESQWLGVEQSAEYARGNQVYKDWLVSKPSRYLRNWWNCTPYSYFKSHETLKFSAYRYRGSSQE